MFKLLFKGKAILRRNSNNVEERGRVGLRAHKGEIEAKLQQQQYIKAIRLFNTGKRKIYCSYSKEQYSTKHCNCKVKAKSKPNAEKSNSRHPQSTTNSSRVVHHLAHLLRHRCSQNHHKKYAIMGIEMTLE